MLYPSVSPEERSFCVFCDLPVVMDELHFMFQCPLCVQWLENIAYYNTVGCVGSLVRRFSFFFSNYQKNTCQTRQGILHNRFCHGNWMIWDAAENVGKVEHIEAADGEWRSRLAAGVVSRRHFILLCRKRLQHHGGLSHTKRGKSLNGSICQANVCRFQLLRLKQQTLFVIHQAREETACV